ncbi:MAG: hypothetical protein IID45_02535, partial [Planctomycetes bacterium]|nr:hypothetical protein [Planctomycetota bacterium]
DDVLPLVPHRNGDIFVPNNEIFGRGQLDIYELTPRNSGGFGFRAEADTPVVFGLYDSNGVLISGPATSGQLTVNLNADATYYFVVSGDPGTYDLIMTGVNQTLAAIIDTPPGAFVGSANGTFTQTHRLDYFRIHSSEAASFLDVSVSADAGLDLWVRVADSNNTVVGFGELGRPGATPVLTNLPVSGDTTYFITVYASYGTTGDYTVMADFYPDQIGFDETIVRPAFDGYTPLVVQADGDSTLDNQSIGSASQLRIYELSPSADGEYRIRCRCGASDGCHSDRASLAGKLSQTNLAIFA